MYDRMCLSMSNGESWRDESGRYFIYFSRREAALLLECGHEKAGHTMQELERIGLIDRVYEKRRRSYRIYPHALEDMSGIQTKLTPYSGSGPPDQTYRDPISGQQSVRKSDTNKTYSNKTDENNILIVSDFPFVEIIKQNIRYDHLTQDWSPHLVDDVVMLMAETLANQQNEIWIDAEPIPKELVRHKFLQLNEGQMRSVLEQAKGRQCEVCQMPHLLLERLFNAVPALPP